MFINVCNVYWDKAPMENPKAEQMLLPLSIHQVLIRSMTVEVPVVCYDWTLSDNLFHSTGAAVAKPCMPI